MAKLTALEYMIYDSSVTEDCVGRSFMPAALVKMSQNVTECHTKTGYPLRLVSDFPVPPPEFLNNFHRRASPMANAVFLIEGQLRHRFVKSW